MSTSFRLAAHGFDELKKLIRLDDISITNQVLQVIIIRTLKCFFVK